MDELDRDVEVKEALEGFAGHWSRDDIAADDDLIYFRLPDVIEDRLQRGQISMDVI